MACIYLDERSEKIKKQQLFFFLYTCLHVRVHVCVCESDAHLPFKIRASLDKYIPDAFEESVWDISVNVP